MNALVRRILLCAALQACAGQAYAHAFPDHARPAVGSTVHGSPAEVRMWFTAPLEPAFSTLKVENAAGERVDRNDRQVDQSDPTQMRVSVPRLANGSYRVRWHVLSTDTHVTDGDFTFEVAP